MSKNEKRSCYNCLNFPLCFLRRNVDKALNSGLHMLNINTKDTPNTFQVVFDALAGACLEYKEQIEK